MNTNIGLWIDHRKAVIILGVGITNAWVIYSNADRQPGRIDGVRSTTPFEALRVPADDVTERKFQHALSIFYDDVIDCIHVAHSLLIFGPGEAKGELKKQLEKAKPGDRIVKMETSDKLTDRQIAAKVHEHFQHQSPVIVSR